MKFDLAGKNAFVAGVGDEKGLGFAIARALCAAGANVTLGVWPPVWNIFQKTLARESVDCEFAHVIPMDAAYTSAADVPADVRGSKRYAPHERYSLQEVAEVLQEKVGTLDMVVHALASSPNPKASLLSTSREEYLATASVTSYSFVALLQALRPLMGEGSAALTLTYLAAERVVPGYGGGLSSAKAALESDVRTLAWELGREAGVRVNALSSGAYASRAAKALGKIEDMVEYSRMNSPLRRGVEAEEVASAALFLVSPLASAITGETVYVDLGLHAMGCAVGEKND